MLMLRFDLFLQSLKLPLLFSFLFLLIKCVHLLLLLGLLTLLILRVLVLPLLQHFLFHHRRTVAELLEFFPPFFLPVLWLVLFNSLNSSYVARTKPLSFKATKSLVPKSLPPLKTSICLNSSFSGTVSDGAVSDSTNTSQSCVALVQYLVSNSKQAVDLDSFNSGDIYLSSLSKFSSFVTTKCSPTFLSLLVSFLALCYSSKLLLIFYLVFLTFLTRCFFLTQSNCVIFSTYILPFYMLPYIFLLILFFIRRYTNFQKCLMFGFMLCKILEIL